MKIDLLCNDGSPIGVTEASITGGDGRMGVGGAELAMLTLCKGWHDRGYEITVYNDPKDPRGSSFEHRPVSAFDPSANRDVLIVFRSPNDRSIGAKGKRIWFSCDQFTVGNFAEFSQTVEKIVVISPFHERYFRENYAINNATVIDLPVRTWEYENPLPKVPKRCIFTSMPERGLSELAPIWKRIVEEVPDAHLVITSDQRLWVDWPGADQHTYPYRAMFGGLSNVTYHGCVTRHHLVQLQEEAELHLYPCVYDELFCISVAESQVAGAYPITSGFGSLSTTSMGTIIEHTPWEARFIDAFVDAAISALNNDNQVMDEIRRYNQQRAKKRFSLDNILNQWDEKIFQ